MAGASVIQVGTATFMKPDKALDIIDGLEQYCADNGLSNIAQIRGIERRQRKSKKTRAVCRSSTLFRSFFVISVLFCSNSNELFLQSCGGSYCDAVCTSEPA